MINPPEWGDQTVGPLNGESGRGLADLLVTVIRAEKGVQSVCDLGCGNGYLAGQIGAHGYRVVGVDASRPYIETANRHYATANVSFRCAPFDQGLTNELTTEGLFDLVVSSDVIEHLYRPSELLSTAAPLLRSGGLLVVGTPYYGYLKNLAISVLDRWDTHHSVHWDGGHIKLFSVRALDAMARSHGFETIRFAFYGRIPWFWKNMIIVAKKVG